MSEQKNIAPWWANGGRARTPGAPQSQGESQAHCGRDSVRPSRVSRLKSLVLALAVALVAGVAWWAMDCGRAGRAPLPGSDAPDERREPHSEIRDQGPKMRGETKDTTQEAGGRGPVRAGTAAPERAAVAPGTNGVLFAGMATNTPPDEAKPEAPRAYRNATEQVMGWIFMCPVGSMPPVLPTLPEEDLANIEKILESPNLVKEGDSDRIADTKETVEYAKAELKRFLADGGRTEDFLRYYHGVLIRAHEQREDARVEYERLSGTEPEMAEAFRTEANKMLSAKGIAPLEKDSGEDDDG